MTACVLLSVLVTQLASAQEAAKPPVEEPSANVEGVDAPTDPSAPAGAVTVSVDLNGPFVAPGATEIAWIELHSVRERQAELSQRPLPSMTLPSVAVALGVPAFGVMLPIGAILVAVGDGTEGSGYVAGAGFIALGIVGFIALVAGATVIARRREARARHEVELKSLIERRALLERVLEAEWRASRTRSTP
ncbi:MAG TPA: hypothetical protein VFZ61_01465 [Polyangiales bacterium]